MYLGGNWLLYVSSGFFGKPLKNLQAGIFQVDTLMVVANCFQKTASETQC